MSLQRQDKITAETTEEMMVAEETFKRAVGVQDDTYEFPFLHA
jgi:hypothetical protein